MEEMSGRVMVCDAGSECWQERMWMNCGRKVKFLSAQHRTLAVSQQRRIIVAAKLLAEKRLVDEDAVGTDEVIHIAGHRKMMVQLGHCRCRG